MYFCVLLILVLQISYSSALVCSCNCPGILLPEYAAYLLGFVVPLLILATVTLTVLLYRQIYAKGSDHTAIGIERHVSPSKYARHESGTSLVDNRFSLTDERAQLKPNEIREYVSSDDDENSDKDHVDYKTNEESKVEPPKKVARVPHQISQSVFPPLNKEQMNKLLKGVLDKTAPKSTSLSDLDKIVSDAKEQQELERIEAIQNSASTTELDVDISPPPSLVIKLPKFEANSIECKLNEEMKAKFSNRNKFKLKDGEINSDAGAQVIGAKHHDDICSVIIHEENSQNDSSKVVLQKYDEIETCAGAVKMEQISVNSDNEGDVHDELYDSPPPPRPQSNLYDHPASKKFGTNYRQSDLYDFPPSPRPHNDTQNEQYHLLPAKDDLYDCPSSKANTPKKTIIVSESNLSEYVFPITNSDEPLEKAQYTNARSMTGLD